MENELEFIDSGDGVSHEFWRNPETKVIYKVDITIIRDWDNMQETTFK